MAKDPKEMLAAFTNGLGELSETNGDQVGAFKNLLGEVYKPTSIDTKTKELISIGISAYNRCEYCIVYHVYKALEAGNTPEEIMDAALVALAFGAGPSIAYTVTLLKDSIEAFAPEFE